MLYSAQWVHNVQITIPYSAKYQMHMVESLVFTRHRHF